MKTLEDMVLFVPDLDHARLREAASGFDPPEDRIMLVQAEYARLLRPLGGTSSDPGTAAWLVLWTRFFQGLQGLRGAVERRSRYTAEILSRAIFETHLHVRAIMRSMTDQASPLDDQLKRRHVWDRLHGYLAWCIWSDAQRWQSVVRYDLRAAYDSRPAIDLAKHHRVEMELMPHMFGDVEVLSEAEAIQEREEAEQAIRARVARYRRWLEDERLRHHNDSLRSRKVRSFLELLDEDESSILKALKTEGIPFAYSIYSEASGVLHGGSLDGILARTPEILTPEIRPTDEDLSVPVRIGLKWAASGFIGPLLLREVLPAPDSPAVGTDRPD